jgi:hypothetical protein
LALILNEHLHCTNNTRECLLPIPLNILKCSLASLSARSFPQFGGEELEWEDVDDSRVTPPSNTYIHIYDTQTQSLYIPLAIHLEEYAHLLHAPRHNSPQVPRSHHHLMIIRQCPPGRSIIHHDQASHSNSDINTTNEAIARTLSMFLSQIF